MKLTKKQWIEFLESREDRLQLATYDDYVDSWTSELRDFLNAQSAAKKALEYEAEASPRPPIYMS